jgi:DNA polymerase elongation subunit (family B)
MKALQYVDTSYVLAIDIETVRLANLFTDLSEDFQSAWEYKNKQDGVVPDQDSLKDSWVRNSSLYPEFSKVCCVSVTYLSKGKLKCKNYVSDNEKLILRELSKDLQAFTKSNSKYTLVGHAAKFFDYPFLAKRYLINNLEIPDILDTSAQKPWESKLLCTNELWRSFGTGSGSSLQALCTAFNLEISKVDLVGDGVGKAYYDDELERIADYCNLDAIACFNVIRKMKREQTFKFTEVVYVNQGQRLEAVPFLTEIHKNKVLTQEQAIAIDAFCLELSVDEINNVKLILEAALINNKGKLKKEHEDFIENL